MNDNKVLMELLIKNRVIKRRQSPLLYASDQIIDEHYRAFLGVFDLKDKHRAELIRQGLSYPATEIHGYKSMPFGSGILIPIRNSKSQITALIARPDVPKTGKPEYSFISAGARHASIISEVPPHFATLGKPIKRELVNEIIIIIESVLKANVISETTDTPVVGLSINSEMTFSDSLAEILKEAFPNLQRVNITFDKDAFANKVLMNGRASLVELLKAAEIESTNLIRNREFKGTIDYLSSQKLAA
jgi:hypothetical protein